MALFGKRKKAEVLGSAVKESINEAEQTQKTQQQLMQNRSVRNRIEEGFFDLLTNPEIAAKSRKAAEANEVKLDKMKASVDALEATGEEKISKLWEMEKDLYIVPGGYAQLPSEDNDVPKTNLDVYNRAVEGLARSFKQKTTADAVASGADRLENFVVQFIGNLRNALETGRAMKANACVDMIKYVLVVGYRYEDAADPQKFEERIKKKVDFISTIGTHLIEAIDYYYTLLTNYELDEAVYAQNLREFDNMVEPFQRDCPPEIKDKLNRLGFKRAIRELPAGDDARKYMGILISSESYLTKALMSSLRLEAFAMEILRESGNIQELVNECKKAFVASGDDFDYHDHFRLMEKIRQKNINEINKLNDIVAEEEDFTRRTQALLDEAAQNEKLANAVANASMAIEKYQRLQDRNEKLKKREKETRGAYRIEKERLEQERIEQERLEEIERQLELEELERMREQEEIIEEQTEEPEILLNE